MAKLTDAEIAAIKQYGERAGESLAFPRILVERGEDDVVSISIDHESYAVGALMLTNALGCASTHALSSIMSQLANLTTVAKEPDQRALDFAVATVAGIQPRDPVESMLAIQMAATHLAVIRHSRMLAHAEYLPQLEAQDRAVNKLMRTFAAQTEALRKYRNGGNQKVEVRHVHVNEGGQAIIGNVERGGGDGQKS